VKIGKVLKTWKQFFKIQDGSGRHLDLWVLGRFDVIGEVKIKVAIFLLHFAIIGQIVKKWQPVFEIEDGGESHLQFVQQYNTIIQYNRKIC